MLLKTTSAWKEIFLLFHMYSLCHNLSREGGINASIKESYQYVFQEKVFLCEEKILTMKKKIHNLNFENFVLF